MSVDPLGTRTPAAAAAIGSRGNIPPPRIAGTSGCPDRGSNVRVNQECTNQTGTVDAAVIAPGRAQAQDEPSIAVNPRNAQNLVVGENNYLRGDGTCAVQYSLDGGQHWGDRPLPISFTPGGSAPRHYWEASGDMSVAFDSSGEAYALCMAFDRGATSEANLNQSAFFLFRSQDGGASWSFPGDVVKGSVTAAKFLDKPYMTVDSNPDSPYRDRIYVSWTEFSALGSPIFFSYSDDHGVTWHTDKTINVANDRDICPVQFSQKKKGACDANQFSEPFVAPNGDVFVVFDNYNNCSGSLRKFGFKCPGPAGDNHNQILLFKSTNGGRSFVGPVRVADYYDAPDCLTYTGENAGRGCFPTAPLSKRSIFRAANYPTGVALKDGVIVIDFGSYINPHSNPARGNCTPAGLSGTTFQNLFNGVGKVNGCNNDILMSVSNDGGKTFTGEKTSPAQLATRSVETAGGPFGDQWWQWTDDVPGPIGVCSSFHDRMYDNDQSTGSYDVSLVCDNKPAIRVTDQHSPPFNEFPGTSGYGLFLGDYSGLAVGPDGVAHPAWADTRNPIYTFNPSADVRKPVFAGHGSDIYTAGIRVTG